jgi:hypothetical protein
MAKRLDCVDALFAFGDIYGLARRHGSNYRRKPIRHSLVGRDFPQPAAFAVRTALPKILRMKSNHLEQKIAAAAR